MEPAQPRERNGVPQEAAVRLPSNDERAEPAAARTDASVAAPLLAADDLIGSQWLPLWRNGDSVDRPHWLLLTPLRQHVATGGRLVLAGAAAIVVLFWVLAGWLILQLA